ncbi:MAG: DUF5942 domain-containing protein [Syntrophobacteraceae bacterium]
MITERMVHALVGVVFWAGYLALRKPNCSRMTTVAMLPVVMLGTWIPDWDLLLGIGFHRHPLSHSILPVLILASATRSFSRFLIPVGLALGVSSHLLWDVIFYGNVLWIPGGSYDRLFLFANSLALIFFAVWRENRTGRVGRSRPLRI